MRGIFANRWWIVFATVCGLIVGGGAINVFAFGVFLKPITAELGIGRAMFSSALTLHSLLSALSCPVVGWLVDRWGARRVMIPGRYDPRHSCLCRSGGLLCADPGLSVRADVSAVRRRRRGRRHRHAHSL